MALTSNSIGIHGESAGYVVSGGLHTDTALSPNASGTVYVEASSPQEAIRQTVVGTISVSVHGTSTNYVFNPTNARLSPADQTPFVVAPPVPPPPDSPPPASPPAVTNWRVLLEDLSNFPGSSDWDYNDHYWAVQVTDVDSEEVATGTVNMSLPTRDIMVNANNDNWNPNQNNAGIFQWKSDKEKYIPGTRDFNATNLWQDDPQLVPVTVTVGGGPGGGVVNGQLSFEESYNNGIGSGAIKLWTSKKRQLQITAPLPIFANNQPKVITIYIEGVVPSALPDAITLHAKFTPQANNSQPVWDSETLTVGPVLESLTTNTGNVRFFNGTDGRQGLQAGKWLGINNPGNASGYQATAKVTHVFAEANNANALSVGFVQNITEVTNKPNGSAAGAVNTVAAQNKNMAPTPASGITLPGPILDSGDPNTPFQVLTMNGQVGSTFEIRMDDTPGFPGPDNPANNTITYDLRYSFKSYLVVIYADGSIYTLGTVTWKVNYYAVKSNPNGTWADTIDPQSAITVTSTDLYSSADPEVTVGPIASGNFLWQ